MDNQEYLRIMRYGVEKELPSGLKVRLRPVDQGMLLNNKKNLPDNLMYIVNKQIKGVKDGRDQKEIQDEVLNAIDDIEKKGLEADPEKVEITAQWYADTRLFGQAAAYYMVIWPKIVDEPQDDDEIHIEWFSTPDLLALAQLVGVPLQALESFRFGQDNSMAPVQPGEGDVSNAESGIPDEPVSEESGIEEGDADSGNQDRRANGSSKVRQRRNNLRNLRRESAE